MPNQPIPLNLSVGLRATQEIFPDYSRPFKCPKDIPVKEPLFATYGFL
jgi:hypothetical protein